MTDTSKANRSVRALQRYIDRLIHDSRITYREWLKRNDPQGVSADD